MAKKSTLGSRNALNRLGQANTGALSHMQQLVEGPEGQVVELPMASIEPNPDQPRKNFDAEALGGLTSSIRDKGLRSPVHVRRHKDGKYVLIEGERRWRAAQAAGHDRIRVFIDDVSPDAAFELALIENMQREDLTSWEEAAGIAELMKRSNYTQIKAAQVLGRSRVAITRLLSLNRIDPAVIEKCSTSNIPLPKEQLYQIAAQKNPQAQMKLAEQVLEAGLTVRQTRDVAQGKPPQKKPSNVPSYTHLERLEKTLPADLSKLKAPERAKIKSRLMALCKAIEV